MKSTLWESAFFVVYPAMFHHLVYPDPFVFGLFHKLLRRLQTAVAPGPSKILLATGLSSPDRGFSHVSNFDLHSRGLGFLGSRSLLRGGIIGASFVLVVACS